MPCGFIAAARASTPRPCMGRNVLTTLRGFTMKPFDCLLRPTRGPFNEGRTVNSLYSIVNPLGQWSSRAWHPARTMANITVTRRLNALALFQDYAEKTLAAGAPPKGLEQSFAAKIQISPSMWSQIKSARPIGDKLARQMEKLCGKAIGWLDEARESTGPTEAEAAFLQLALAAWRRSNANGRRAMREQLRSYLSKAGSG